MGPALTINMHRKEGSDLVSALDIFPWHKQPAPDEEVFVGTPEERAQRIGELLMSMSKPEPKGSHGRK